MTLLYFWVAIQNKYKMKDQLFYLLLRELKLIIQFFVALSVFSKLFSFSPFTNFFCNKIKWFNYRDKELALISDPTLTPLCEKYEKSPAQVSLGNKAVIIGPSIQTCVIT